MNILVIGSGGREHAMVWKLAQSEKCDKIWAAPGNGGTATEKKTENFPLSADPASEDGQKTLLEFAKKEKIDLTVVGPEAPLAEGIVDRFRAKGLAILGPDKKAAQLEASKVFAKSFMVKYGIRAPHSRSFANTDEALKYAGEYFAKTSNSKPLVIKADGLAAGKGVAIAASLKETETCLSAFMKNASLGEAGKSVVLEDFLDGREVSILAAVSASPGKKSTIIPFIPARDHKNRYEGGKGPNTGGMGSIAPIPDFGDKAFKDFESAILLPTIKGMEEEKLDYRGFIFFGLMVKDDVCQLLEYNVRLGDPETQAVLPLMEYDFTELCFSILSGNFSQFSDNGKMWKNEAACVPVLAADGYPGTYRKGDSININMSCFEKTGVKLFMAGAQKKGESLQTSGGRVLAVCALGSDGEEARKKAYEALDFINFEGMAYRKDIGLPNG